MPFEAATAGKGMADVACTIASGATRSGAMRAGAATSAWAAMAGGVTEAAVLGGAGGLTRNLCGKRQEETGGEWGRLPRGWGTAGRPLGAPTEMLRS